MKTPIRNLGLLFLFFSVASCFSGKKAYNSGRYYEAVRVSAIKLQKKPNHSKARAILPKAYQAVVKRNSERINQLKTSNNPFRWDEIIEKYNELNQLHDLIHKCPTCESLISNPFYYQHDLENAKKEGAEVHFNEGVKLMNLKTTENARQAHRHFTNTKNYAPGYPNIEDWLSKSFNAGLLKVVIDNYPVNSSMYQITNEFFGEKIMEYARNMGYKYVRFYSPSEINALKLTPDQVVKMRFIDFTVGNTYVKETVEKLSKDSVKIAEKTEGGKKVPIYGTVKAQLHTFKKAVDSKGLLELTFTDYSTQAVLKTERLPGSYTWFSDWGFFNGDEKALTKEQLAICRRREIPPPPPQDLFIQFTGPIFNQASTHLRTFYTPYRQ